MGGRRDSAGRGRSTGRRGVRGPPAVADHDQRQRRRAAVLPAARVSAGHGSMRARSTGRAPRSSRRSRRPATHGIPLRDELELEMTTRVRCRAGSSDRRRAARPRARPRPSRRGRDPRRLRGRARPRLPRDRRERPALDPRRDPRGPPRRTAGPVRSRSRPSRSPTSGRTWSSRPMTPAASRPTARERRSRRSSIWLRHDDRWQLRFNQGTRIPNSAEAGPTT